MNGKVRPGGPMMQRPCLASDGIGEIMKSYVFKNFTFYQVKYVVTYEFGNQPVTHWRWSPVKDVIVEGEKLALEGDIVNEKVLNKILARLG